LLIRGF
jgi:ABC-type multidrug transport system fused ATPase/permease subunit